VRIKALAGETPTASGQELSQWSLPTLADEAVQRGIVKTVSPASVGHFLNMWTDLIRAGIGSTRLINGIIPKNLRKKFKAFAR
jgi:hypothetical protein